MFNELEKQLENSLSEIILLWVNEQQSSSAPPVTTIPHSVVSRCFLMFITGMRRVVEIADKQRSIASVIPDEIDFFLKTAGQMSLEGHGTASIISSLKSMRAALEYQIHHCIARDSDKLTTTAALNKVTDTIETAVLTEQSIRGENEPLQELQSACQYAVQAKITYKNIFESTSNLVLITDEQGIIVKLNPAAKLFFSGEYTEKRFCGELLQLEDNLELLLKRYPPDTANEVCIHSGGVKKIFNLQIRLLSCRYPLASGLFLILNDITYSADHRQVLEQRVAERTRSLAKSEKLLDSLFQSIGKGVLLLDQDLEIVQANRMASEMYGIPLEVLVGSHYQSLTNEKGLADLSRTLEELEEGKVYSIESESTYVDGRRFPCLVTLTSMYLDDQIFWPVIVWDITSQKELEADIIEQKQHAEEMNVTLRNVLKSIEKEKQEFEENLSSRIRSSLLPTISRIRREPDAEGRDGLLSLLEEQMISLTADFTAAIDGDLLKLSKTELRICQLIKAGLTGKEIGSTLNLSFETIQTHRKNIRRKLGLRGREVNLHAYFADRVL